MSRINRYQYKQGAPLPKDMHLDGGWIKGGAMGYVSKTIRDKDHEFNIYVAFDRDMDDWNDFDNIAVTTEWDEPYHPFFQFWDEEVEDFPTLEFVIERYNEFMDSLDFLEPLDNMYKRYD